MSKKFNMTLMTRQPESCDGACLTTAQLYRDVGLDKMFGFIDNTSLITKIALIRTPNGYSSVYVKSMLYDGHGSLLCEKDVTIFPNSEPFVLKQTEIDNIICKMFIDNRFKDYFACTFRANISPIFVDDCPF